MNKELEVPLVPQKIAIISSPTAAGYEDFCNQLNNNSSGFKFYLKLFPAIMQGDKAEESVTAALDKIYEYEHFFDVVVIIRGGGSTSDLMCFDSYWLAYNIAQFPLPVFSGIGHERDETIVDYVAHTRLKTPTAVAEHILELVSDFNNRLEYLKDAVINNTRDIMSDHRASLERASSRFKPLVSRSLLTQKNQLDRIIHQVNSASNYYIDSRKNKLNMMAQRLKSASHNNLNAHKTIIELVPQRLSARVKFFFNHQQSQLKLLTKTNELLDPKNILKKGYSITYLNGKAVKSIEDVKSGDIISTQLKDGNVKSTVN